MLALTVGFEEVLWPYLGEARLLLVDDVAWDETAE
jgi:hypothetical protein